MALTRPSRRQLFNPPGVDMTGAVSSVADINSFLDEHAGEVCELSHGNILIDGTIIVPPGTTLRGVGACDILAPATTGTNILITHTTGAGILLGRGVTIEGINIWYPNQVTTTSPVVYDYAIETDVSGTPANNAGITIRDVVIHNAYNGINLAGDPTDSSPNTAVVVISNLKMYAINIGVRQATAQAEVQFSNCDFSPVVWPQSSGKPIRSWVIENGTSIFLIESMTGAQFNDCAFIQHRRGIYLHNAALTNLTQGNVTFLSASSCILDGLKDCIEVDGYLGIGNGRFSNCYFSAQNPLNTALTGCSCIYGNDTINNNSIQFTGCVFSVSSGYHIRWVNPSSSAFSWLTFSGCFFYTPNAYNNSGAYYNVYADDDGLTLSIDAIVQNQNTDATDVVYRVVSARDLIVYGEIWTTTTTPYEITAVANNIDIKASFRGVLPGTYPSAIVSLYTLASAGTLAIPANGSGVVYVVTGTTNITSITPSWPGRQIVLKFNGALTVTDGSNLRLTADFTTSADDTLTLICDGTNWYEVARSAN